MSWSSLQEVDQILAPKPPCATHLLSRYLARRHQSVERLPADPEVVRGFVRGKNIGRLVGHWLYLLDVDQPTRNY